MTDLPPYAYVPGQTARHPEGAFEPIRSTAEANPLASQAMSTGLDWIDSGYFWESHEVLEPVWLALPDGTPERLGVQALIQLANAGLKARMDRPAAAARICDMAAALMDEAAPFTTPNRPAQWFADRLAEIRQKVHVIISEQYSA